MSEIGLVQIIEGALLAADKPLTVAQLAELFEEHERPDNTAIREAITEAQARCEDRGFELQEVASGFRFQVAEDVHGHVARLWAERPARYSRALLETLALIAYRQPITRGEIEQIRGVAVSTGIIKTMEEREWIRVVGHRDVPGRPALFGTTRGFLDYFGLRSLDQLPPLSELQDIPELEPELPLEPIALRADTPKPQTDDGDAATAAAATDDVVESTASVDDPAPDDAQDSEEPRRIGGTAAYASALGRARTAVAIVPMVVLSVS